MANEVLGYDFDIVGDIEPMRGIDGSIQQHMPQDRYRNALTSRLNSYGAGPFCKFRVPNHFQSSGVYMLTVGDAIRYVGECANLSSRFNMGYGNISPKNCFKGGQETNCRLNNLIYLSISMGHPISLWFHQTIEYKKVERTLRAMLKPIWNRA